MRTQHRLVHLSSGTSELEDYENVISDLDREFEQVQRQIQELKVRKQKEEGQKNEPVLTPKQLKYAKFQQKALEDQQLLAHRFVESRAAISQTFSNPANVSKLFESEHLSSQANTDNTTEKYESDPSARKYSSPIQNSLMSLSHSMINTCLVELNLRFALYDEQLKKYSKSSASLYRPRLFECMQPDGEKKEMIDELASLRATHPVLSKPFLAQLDSAKVHALFDAFQISDHFASKETRRSDMYIHKSGRWRNYEYSDTTRSIKASQGPVFQTSSVNNDEYIAKFKGLFAAFEANKHPLKHISLVLAIAKLLEKGGNNIPSNAIFRDLQDRFGSVGLHNYQSLVYDLLPPFEHRETAWADGSASHAFAEKELSHFRSLIEEDPKLLGSIIEYNRKRGNAAFIKTLLRFLEPLNVPSNQSILPHFMIKHSFQTNSDVAFKVPVLFEKDIISLAIRACVETRDYKSIDRLLNTLVFNSIETADGVRLLCGQNTSKYEVLNHASDEAVSKLFDENLLCMLGKAYVQNNDQRRCEWIAPLIKKYINQTESTRLESVYDSIQGMLETQRGAAPRQKRSQKPFKKENFSYSNSGFGDESIHQMRSVTA